MILFLEFLSDFFNYKSSFQLIYLLPKTRVVS